MPTPAAVRRYERWKQRWVRVEFRLTKEQADRLDALAASVGEELNEAQQARSGRQYDRKAAFVRLLEAQGDTEEEWDKVVAAVNKIIAPLGGAAWRRNSTLHIRLDETRSAKIG